MKSGGRTINKKKKHLCVEINNNHNIKKTIVAK